MVWLCLRRENSEAVKKVMEMNVRGRRGRGRPKKWLDATGCDEDSGCVHR